MGRVENLEKLLIGLIAEIDIKTNEKILVEFLKRIPRDSPILIYKYKDDEDLVYSYLVEIYPNMSTKIMIELPLFSVSLKKQCDTYFPNNAFYISDLLKLSSKYGLYKAVEELAQYC